MRYSVGSEDHEHPSTEQLQQWRRRASAPENEAPAGLEFSAVLGLTDETAVCVTGFRVYSAGLAFTLSVRLRKEPRRDVTHQFHELISGYGPGSPDRDLDQRLLLGVEYADGRTATNLTSDGPPRFEESATETIEPLLRSSGGGGGGRTYDQEFWLSPVPPSGPLTFVCRWPSHGITERPTELDGAQIADALARVQVLWPWEPDDEEPEPEPMEPQLPTEGWFAGALRRRHDR